MTDNNFPRYYILVDRVPFAVDMMTWAKWYNDFEKCRVALTVIDGKLDVYVSTVFLGLDHNFGDGDPLLFETMAFDGKDSLTCDRYRTWLEAEAGHARVVTEIRALMSDTKNAADSLLAGIVAKISPKL